MPAVILLLLQCNFATISPTLLHHSLSGVAPEGDGAGLVGGRQPLVARAGPEPPVHVDGVEALVLAALALEVALAAGGVD